MSRSNLNTVNTLSKLESYFQNFKDNIVGTGFEFISPYGKKEIIYADWTASGRLIFEFIKLVAKNFKHWSKEYNYNLIKK